MSPQKTIVKQTRPTKVQARPRGRQIRLYKRFHWSQRVAHAVLLVSFSLLGITGLPQKFAAAGWAQAMIGFFGGIESTRLIHHVSAVILMFLAIYHILDVGYKIFVLHTPLSMLPGIKDVKDAIQAFGYNLGLRKRRPQMGRYTFEEKAEYWALIWGTVIMGVTGFLMWNPIAATKILPGEFIPAAKAAHGGEALLAVMAIVVWHMYGVHLKRFNKSMWTGRQTEAEMLHEHPLELADMKAGLAERPVDPKTLRRRRMIYYPTAGILTAVMLLGVYGFVIREKTAITTVPPIQNPVPIYVPLTPTPIPTVSPPTTSGTLALTWNGSIGPIFQSACGACHGAGSFTGLSMDNYANLLKGGKDGPVIIPGEVDGSKLIQIQAAGGHPGQFGPDDLAKVKEWITAGLPEK